MTAAPRQKRTNKQTINYKQAASTAGMHLGVVPEIFPTYVLYLFVVLPTHIEQDSLACTPATPACKWCAAAVLQVVLVSTA